MQLCSIVPLCSTALAGLFPDMDSLLRCWWDSAKHSTSLKRVLSAMEGWDGSSVMFRYAALRSCSSITNACSNSWEQTGDYQDWHLCSSSNIHECVWVTDVMSMFYLKPASEELIFDLEEVSTAHLSFEWLIEDGKARIILNILPTSIAMSENTQGQGL